MSGILHCLMHEGNPKSILFLSQHNAARTQMAKGPARGIFAPMVKSMCAGTHPSAVDPLAAEVMAAIGIDIRDQSSKPFFLITPATVDVIIVIGAQDITLPVLAGQTVMKWSSNSPLTPNRRWSDGSSSG